MAKKRSIKVYGQSGYKYQETPTIMLKGKWLEELGFKIGDYISIACEDGRLVITPDAERAAVKAAEAEYMEREMKALQKRYEAEKVKIRDQIPKPSGTHFEKSSFSSMRISGSEQCCFASFTCSKT